jgi:D-alanyl-D-alanine carboxypeptidase
MPVRFFVPIPARAWFHLALMAVLMLTFTTAPAEAARKRAKFIPGYASIVVDSETGQVLLAESPDRALPPASLTKMMTLLLTFDALAQKRMRLNDYIVISSHAARASPSKLGIRPGGRLDVDDAIKAIAVKSANDIAIAMAEALGGSESRFAKMMNARAKSIGMTHTRFVNASGLNASGQVSSARDMAILARYIITIYPQYYRYFGLRSFNYGGRNHPNHNKLMNNYYGMDGMKTGYISQSGFNLVASAVHSDRRLIGVVFGGRTANSRNARMAELLDRGFRIPVRKGTKTRDIAQAAPPPSIDKIPEIAAAPTPPSAKPGRKPNLPETPVAMETIYVPRETPAPTGGSDPTRWTVQLGAYQDRESTDRALAEAVKVLPPDLARAKPVVAPIKTLQSGWLFRARLADLSQDDARRVCTYFRGCLLISPEGTL